MKVYTKKKNFLALAKEFSSYKDSYISILPVPYEYTTSYRKGTVSGPAAILDASQYVEFFDEELNRELCFQKGISTIKSLNLEKRKGKKAIEYIYKVVQKLINDGKYVVTLGGEHTVAIAPIKAHLSVDKDISILQFDAHSDLRERYEGRKYSHACFASRIAEFTSEITQVGVRAQCKEEHNFIKEKKINTYYSFEIRNGKFGDWHEAVLNSLKEKVYVTFDLDYFDPSLMPSTGTPEPNGFFWEETMKLLRKLGQERKVIGLDVVELAPIKGFHSSDYLTAKLIYKMLNYFIK